MRAASRRAPHRLGVRRRVHRSRAPVCSTGGGWRRTGRPAIGWRACTRRSTVDKEAIFVRDGRVWTSAGVTTGIDMALAMVEEDHGRRLADSVAAHLVLYARRPGFQSQFTEALVAQTRRRIRSARWWRGCARTSRALDVDDARAARRHVGALAAPSLPRAARHHAGQAGREAARRAGAHAACRRPGSAPRRSRRAADSARRRG